MTLLIVGIFIGAAVLIHLLALMPKPGRVRDEDREPVSEDAHWPLDGMHDWMNPDPAMGAEKIAAFRRTGGF